VQREKQTELLFGYAKLLEHQRHRDAEIAAHEIKRGVADDGEKKDARLPVAVFRGDFRRVGEHDGRGRGGLENFQQAGIHALAELLMGFFADDKQSFGLWPAGARNFPVESKSRGVSVSAQ
jgi:hypothetical protein